MKQMVALWLGLWLMPAFGDMFLPTTSEGDGYYHNESGSSYDFFDSTSDALSAYYTYWGTSDTLQYNTGYLQFSLASVGTGASVSSVTLNLYLLSSHYGSDSPSAGFIRHAANSSGANGLASQKIGGTEDVVEIKDQADGWLSLDVTSMVLNDLDQGYGYSCFSLNPNTSGYFRDAGFTVASADATGNHPYLQVTSIPEPGMVALTLAGVLVTAGMCRIRRRLP